MCDKAGNTYPSTINFVRECFIPKERCNKAVNKCLSVFESNIPHITIYLSTKMLQFFSWIICLETLEHFDTENHT